jgi:23S rRNA (cytidine1920-2'-O)/16S rRNA (cytidine1409-2'-O)-methyltransferase
VRRRLDAELVRRGLAADRTEARGAVTAGRVLVGGRPAANPDSLVAPDEAVSIGPPPRPFASRGGQKLAPALDRFAVDVRHRRCLDAGASTGGFTDVLLSRGASHVVAVDVGYGELAWKLRTDPRVTVMERTNVRSLRRNDLPFEPELLVADLSFISLTVAIPVLAGLAVRSADLVMLVKPQFEAEADRVGPGGVVTDSETWKAAVERVAAACASAGIGLLGAAPSSLLGPAGNVEFFVHGRKGTAGVDLDFDSLLAEAGELRRARVAGTG